MYATIPRSVLITRSLSSSWYTFKEWTWDLSSAGGNHVALVTAAALLGGISTSVPLYMWCRALLQHFCGLRFTTSWCMCTCIVSTVLRVISISLVLVVIVAMEDEYRTSWTLKEAGWIEAAASTTLSAVTAVLTLILCAPCMYSEDHGVAAGVIVQTEESTNSTGHLVSSSAPLYPPSRRVGGSVLLALTQQHASPEAIRYVGNYMSRSVASAAPPHFLSVQHEGGQVYLDRDEDPSSEARVRRLNGADLPGMRRPGFLHSHSHSMAGVAAAPPLIVVAGEVPRIRRDGSSSSSSSSGHRPAVLVFQNAALEYAVHTSNGHTPHTTTSLSNSLSVASQSTLTFGSPARDRRLTSAINVCSKPPATSSTSATTSSTDAIPAAASSPIYSPPVHKGLGEIHAFLARAPRLFDKHKSTLTAKPRAAGKYDFDATFAETP
jgi:hypothetical protein